MKGSRMGLKSSLIAGATVALAATFGLAAPATATEAAPEVTATQPAPSALTAHDYLVRSELERLVGTQTQAEIDALMNSGLPVTGWVDPETNTVVAARLDDAPVFNPFAITQRGPGCATGDACATNSNANGYYGTGTLNINLTGVTKIFSGSHSTTWWQGGTGTFQAPNVTLQYAFPGANLTSISRS